MARLANSLGLALVSAAAKKGSRSVERPREHICRRWLSDAQSDRKVIPMGEAGSFFVSAVPRFACASRSIAPHQKQYFHLLPIPDKRLSDLRRSLPKCAGDDDRLEPISSIGRHAVR